MKKGNVKIVANIAPIATLIATPFSIAQATEIKNIEAQKQINVIESLSVKQNSKQKLQVKEILSTNNSWDGTKLPSYPISNPLVRVLHIIVPPHAVLPEHHHDVMSYGYIIRGELTIQRTDNGQEITLHAGDAVAETVSTKHIGENRGNEPTELVVFYPSIEGMPLSVPG